MTEASESAALVLRMKRKLMDLVNSQNYASALLVCQKLAILVPHDTLVTQYRTVLGEKVALDEANGEEEDGEELENDEDDGDTNESEEESDEESSQEENETSSASSDDEGEDDDTS